eukprot:COSAG01_NODE_2391_length_7773_cov_102.532056_2_plen_43_part_00
MSRVGLPMGGPLGFTALGLGNGRKKEEEKKEKKEEEKNREKD